MAETVTFVVGGTSFQVERILLDQYPSSLLNEKAVINRDDPDSADIIIDCNNPSYFEHVLTYMREGGTFELPESLCKAKMCEELDYYNIDYSGNEGFFEDCETAAASLIRGAECMQRVADFIARKGHDSIFKGECMLLAQACIQEYEKRSFQGKKFELKANPENYSCLKEAERTRVECNLHLKRVGLQIDKVQGKRLREKNREKTLFIVAKSP